MFLSRMFSATPVLGGLLVAAAALLPAGQASAQAPNNIVSKFDRANAGVMLPGAYWSVPQVWALQHTTAPQAYYTRRGTGPPRRCGRCSTRWRRRPTTR